MVLRSKKMTSRIKTFKRNAFILNRMPICMFLLFQNYMEKATTV